MAKPKPVLDLTIDALGRQGDGIAAGDRGPIYVAGALAGDVVRARMTGQSRADIVEILSPSADRVSPPCPYFGECGGCMAQHMAEDLYSAWKTDGLMNALRHRGLGDVTLDPLARVPPGSLRRTRLAYRTAKKGVSLGYRARGSKRTVDVESCLLLTPALGALLAPIRGLLAPLTRPGTEGEITLTETDSGVDLNIESAGSLDMAARESLAAFAVAHDLARLSHTQSGTTQPEMIAMNRTPVMKFGGVAVALPDGAFLQPSAAGETLILHHVLNATREASRVADLYAGCGTFSLPIAANGTRVLAVEGDDAMSACLRTAAGQIRAHLEVETRDLARRPLDVAALAGIDALILDPPRAGALSQMQQIAVSKVATIVSVSCNPATFARDARVLVDGGYRLSAVSPIDQFPFSSHLEVVGIFRR